MISIGEVSFEERTRINLQQDSYRNIYTAYKKPSLNKIKIWLTWLEWFNKYKTNNSDFIEVVAPNCFFFSIQGKIQGRKFYITKSYNYIQAHTLDDVTIK